MRQTFLKIFLETEPMNNLYTITLFVDFLKSMILFKKNLHAFFQHVRLYKNPIHNIKQNKHKYRTKKVQSQHSNY